MGSLSPACVVPKVHWSSTLQMGSQAAIRAHQRRCGLGIPASKQMGRGAISDLQMSPQK